MTWAIIRLRGKVTRSAQVADTLRMLRLTRQNHCVIVPENPAYRGMVKKVKDFITWGEVTPEVVAKLLLKRGGLTDAAVKENSRFKSVWDFSQALAKGEATVADVKGLRPVLRLHPPRGGFIAIKRPFRDRGDLGYRGAKINELLERMIFEEAA